MNDYSISGFVAIVIVGVAAYFIYQKRQKEK